MSWDVHFTNGYNRRVQVAIAFYQPSCSKLWGTRGWWIIEPGGSKYVINTNNRYMFFYAESVSDGRVWAGDVNNYIDAYVTTQAFDSCVGIGSTNARIVRMKPLDLNVNNKWRLV
jgi:uncharacterized membrane protein